MWACNWKFACIFSVKNFDPEKDMKWCQSNQVKRGAITSKTNLCIPRMNGKIDNMHTAKYRAWSSGECRASKPSCWFYSLPRATFHNDIGAFWNIRMFGDRSDWLRLTLSRLLLMRIMLFFMTLPESYFVTKWSLSQLTISTNLTRGQPEWLLFADKGELNTSNRRIKVRFTLLDTKIGDQGLLFTPYTVHRTDLLHAKVSALDSNEVLIVSWYRRGLNSSRESPLGSVIRLLM